VSSALVNRIVETLASHRVLVQRDWDDERAQLAAAS
jgi:hypothetical protein